MLNFIHQNESAYSSIDFNEFGLVSIILIVNNIDVLVAARNIHGQQKIFVWNATQTIGFGNHFNFILNSAKPYVHK